MRTSLSLAAVGLLGLSALGCDSGTAPVAAEQAAVTYHHDAAPLLARYCSGCHEPGGIGPIDLSSYASAKAGAAALRAAVDSGRMPPWMPSDVGVPLRNSRLMRAADRDLLLRWVDGGATEGDASQPPRADIPAADPAPAPPRPDLTVDPGLVYQPKTGRADDYRCFLFDPKLQADTWISAGTVNPDNKAIVHHVLIYEIKAADAPSVRKKDGADGTPGYTCFGGPGSNNPQTLLGWAPGGVAMRAPAGMALKVSAGSLLAMQIHYNLQGYRGTGDRTTAILEMSDRPPARQLYNIPLANPSKLHIAAGDPSAKQDIAVPVSGLQQFYKLPPGDLLIHASAPHMHLLGTHITTAITGGPTLVDIPRWDFHWQQGFFFVEPVRVQPTDLVALQCVYDNSAQHQPVVDGQQQAPRDVTWGEGTNDEMCLTYLSVSTAQ